VGGGAEEERRLKGVELLQRTCGKLRLKIHALLADKETLLLRVSSLEAAASRRGVARGGPEEEEEGEEEEGSRPHGGVEEEEKKSRKRGGDVEGWRACDETKELVLATLNAKCTKARLEAEALRRENRALLTDPAGLLVGTATLRRALLANLYPS
jgi:hypothetical protein